MLSASPLPLILRMASPNAIAFLVQSSVGMTEIWFVGRLGTGSLAAIALMFPLLMLMQMLANGAIGGAMTSAVARAIGAGRKDRAEALIWHALVIAAIAGAGFWAAWHGAGAVLLGIFAAPDPVVAEAARYGNVLFAGSAAIWTTALLAAVVRGTGDMKTPAAVMIVGAVVQIPLSGLLVLGWLGMPSLGIAGAAVSTIVVATMTSFVLLWRLAGGPGVIRLRARSMRLDAFLFADIFRVGALAALSPLFAVLTVLLANVLISGFGPEALAGYGIAARLEFLLIPLVFGIGSALTALVGTNSGAGNLVRAERIAWIGATCAALLTGVVGTVLAVWPALWMSLFTNDPDTWHAGAMFFRIVGPAMLFQGLGLSLYFASQGAGTVLWPVIATVLRFVMAIGGAAICIGYFDMGLESVFVFIAAGMVLYGAITAGSIRLGAWRPQPRSVH
jgi:putative MATE family efflux protein